MAMDIEGTYTFQAPIEQVWNTLLDPEVLARCLPGVESMHETSPDTYAVQASLTVGPVKGAWTGTVALTEKQAPSHYRLTGDFSGPRGFVKGDGTIDLTAQGSNTVAHYKGTPQLGGAIAGVAMRMIPGLSKQMANQFFGAIAQELRAKEEPAAVAAPAEAAPTATSAPQSVPKTASAPRATRPTASSAPQPVAITRPAAAQPGFLIQLVRLLKVSDGSPEDEQRWVQRLVIGGVGAVIAIALLGFILGRFSQRNT
jgi:carbon monoxide dehydrogenase subunit G